MTAPCAKKPAGILSLLRMPFRQGALGLVFQSAVPTDFGKPFSGAGVSWGMADEQPGREICARCGHERALHSDDEGLFCAFNAERFECPCETFEWPAASADPLTTSRRQAPDFDVDGYHCWTGPSGTRFAAPGDRRDVFRVLASTSDLHGVPHNVIAWLRSGS